MNEEKIFNSLIKKIRNRILRYNKNWLAITCGETGSGKSYASISIAKMVDPKFTLDQLVFYPEEFMQLLNSGKLKRGNVVVWDEAGVGNSLNYQNPS